MTRRLAVAAAAALVAGALSTASAQQGAAAPSGPAAPPPPAAAPAASITPTGNAANGKKLYERVGCWQCHGYAGQGGRAVPDAVPLAGTALPLAAFVRYVRQPAGAMPAYTVKVMSDQELADVYAHIKTLSGPRPPAQIPLLKDLGAR
jgi:hypothetical protein